DAYRLDAWVPRAQLVVEKRDPWKAGRNYKTDDEVWHNKQLYRAKTPNKGAEPPGKRKEWEKLSRKWSLATDISLQKIFSNHAAGQNSALIMLNNAAEMNEPLMMKPGETVVFSPDLTLPELHKSGDFQLCLRRGLNTQGGISFDKLASPQAGKAAENAGMLPVYGDSEIRVTLEPARDGSYKTDDPFDFIASYANAGLDETPPSVSAQPYRESLGYFQGSGRNLDALVWAGTRAGEAPCFAYDTRAYTGKDKSGRPMPGQSDTLKIGKQVNETEKRFLGLIDWRLKTEADANGFPLQMIARFDPRCVFIHQLKQGYPCTIPTYQLNARKLTSGTSLIELQGDQGYWGPSSSASGEHYTPLFEIPTAPLLSLGQLQHYHAGAAIRPYVLNPGYVIGNSWAHPYVGRDRDEETYDANVTIVDLSHKINSRLFDRYFFSSISPLPGDETVSNRISSFVTDTDPIPLPNPRMRLYLPPGQTTANLRRQLTKTPDANEPPPFGKVAASLLIEGAFNVNSTSIEAWKSLLASLDAFDVPVLDPSGTSTALVGSKGAPQTRFTLSNGDSSKRWRGFRSLTDKEVQALAEAIVCEVKIRGPFSSLSDFVNRRLKKDDSGLCGALQAAINRTSINHDFTALVTDTQLRIAAQQGKQDSGADWSFPYPAHCTGPIGAGAAGFLTQGDLLQSLAPHLSARSDTFKVRAYGDVVDPVTGKLEARAWCEAIVQRLPEYMNIIRNGDDKAEPAWTSPTDLKLDSNRSLGRRFRIVRIRWLSPDEV
ncbi:MAG: hypothetical protein RL693_1127, partial [Verrucomicrobiota bacterium]